MSYPELGAGQSDGREKVSGQLAAARGGRAEALELGEETLDRIALPVQRRIDRAPLPPVAFLTGRPLAATMT